MKKIFFALFIVFLILPANKAKATTHPPSISSESAVLIDATTGKVLYDKNMKEPLAPASTTKIMTALLTIEKCKLDEQVTVGKNPPNAEGTAIGLKEGEIISVKDLLYGLLLESANDCAEALAEHISGSIDGFAKLMNEKAKQLGCENTNFVNPSGLYEKDHLTTAYDLSLILREVSKLSVYLEISKEPFYKIQPTNKSNEVRWVNNKNNLILKNNRYFDKDCVAGKTGFTTPSKHTFTATAERNGQRLIVTILKSDDKSVYFPEAKALFDYGFAKYELVKLYARGDEVSTYKINDSLSIPLLAYDDFYFIKDKEDTSLKELSPVCSVVPQNLEKASFNRGDKILDSNISLNNDIIGKLPLASGVTREMTPLTSAKETIKKNSISIFIITPVILFLALISIRIINLRIRRARRMKKFNSTLKKSSML